MRVYVYVDGFNLYYRALRRSPHKWLDLACLARSLLDPTDNVACTRVLKVARTIADLAGAAGVGKPHIAEALAYRRIAQL